ncbi:MAG TPA: protein translocase subunit SecD [Candidatus Syntrophosphaera sp.]|nr:protein translocase subunit SecD [Candidatus Syntrophosphaera sp.]
MKKYSWLIPVSILVFVLGTLIFLSPLLIPKSVNWPIKQKLNLGLDLKGGTQIVLRVVTDSLADTKVTAAVDNNIRIIRNRIDQYGIAEPTIQKSKEDEIIVQLPGVKDPIAAENLVKQAAVLQFQLVAQPEESEKFLTQLDSVIQENLQLFPELAKIDAEDKAAAEKAESDTTRTGSGIFRSLISTDKNDYVVRSSDLELMQDILANPAFTAVKPKGFDLVLASAEEGVKSNEPSVIYVLRSTVEVKGTEVDRASWEIGSSDNPNPQMANKPYITLDFTREGARKFATVTGDNINQRLAIVVDEAVYSAPVIKDRIPDGKATISGMFSNEQAKSLAILLDNESLTAKIEPQSSTQVSATLGADSIKSGLRAGLIGVIAVAIFMLLYYKLSGLVADFVLLFNIGFILAALTAFGGTLTMPGIAGIILTVGMAVDANVLIFERIREELEAGRPARSAVDAGYKRATVTIVDSNLTTLIAAFVLYQFGTGPIRGFALTLTIGIVGSMFCAIVFVRYIMDKTMLSGIKPKISI